MEISETVKVISHVGRDRPLKVVPPNVKIIEFAQPEIFWNGPRQGIGIQIEIFQRSSPISSRLELSWNVARKLVVRKMQVFEFSPLTNVRGQRPFQLVMIQVEALQGSQIVKLVRQRSVQLIGRQVQDLQVLQQAHLRWNGSRQPRIGEVNTRDLSVFVASNAIPKTLVLSHLREGSKVSRKGGCSCGGCCARCRDCRRGC
mmetsp:Transcript_11336/g.20374  ORF Transcript_11336/g.20374 Transcript_11336/m.20374 type:complete len:201 (-) Transcript_11336:111-713(-)